MTSIITQSKAKTSGNTVLLFSGGMDSLICAYLLNPDVLLYIPTSGKYRDEEKRCIDQLQERGFIRDVVELPGVLDLSQYERDDLIIPNRNAHLVLLASHYGENIILASVEGDRSTDKDAGFYDRMTEILNHMWQPQHWCEGRSFNVSSPIKHLTKTDITAHYLSGRGPAEALLISYSCYRGDPVHCGVCKPCMRKRVALKCNGVDVPDGYFEKDFWKEDWFAPYWQSIVDGKDGRGREDADFLFFTSMSGFEPPKKVSQT